MLPTHHPPAYHLTTPSALLCAGPNPKLEPSAGVHWFDGDGMIHAVKFSGGKASYCNRWVDTARLRQEQKAGWPVAVKSEWPARQSCSDVLPLQRGGRWRSRVSGLRHQKARSGVLLFAAFPKYGAEERSLQGVLCGS